MFRFPEVYKAGLALAFVSDQRLYDATYQERYMGLLRIMKEVILMVHQLPMQKT